jgi:hypothetical protein
VKGLGLREQDHKQKNTYDLRSRVPCDSRFQCQITQKASTKDLGPREQDQEILKKHVRAEEAGVVQIVRDFNVESHQNHQRKALVRVSKTTKYSERFLHPDESCDSSEISDPRQQKHQRKALVRVS